MKLLANKLGKYNYFGFSTIHLENKKKFHLPPSDKPIPPPPHPHPQSFFYVG